MATWADHFSGKVLVSPKTFPTQTDDKKGHSYRETTKNKDILE